jgi:hypothetical protein
MVLFLGIELFLGATWEASSSLAPLEWAVVMGTLAACTFFGFAEGFGAGVGTATVVYLIYGVLDSVRTSCLLRCSTVAYFSSVSLACEDYAVEPVDALFDAAVRTASESSRSPPCYGIKQRDR